MGQQRASPPSRPAPSPPAPTPGPHLAAGAEAGPAADVTAELAGVKSAAGGSEAGDAAVGKARAGEANVPKPASAGARTATADQAGTAGAGLMSAGGGTAPGGTRVLTISLTMPRLPGGPRRRDRATRRGEDATLGRLSYMAGRGFARLTVLPAIGLVAWLIPGLPLLLAGEFLPVPELLIAAPLFAVLTVNVLHRVPARWPVDLPGKARDRGWMPWLGVLGTAAVAAVFTAWQLALDSPSVIETRTPGALFQTGYWIAQHGSLPIPGLLTAFGGAHPGLHLSSSGFFQAGHAVVPAVTSGLPMLLAAGFWTSGVSGGAVIGPVLGGLAVLSFGGLVGRLVGRQWAPAGALALALTLPELYTSRNAFSEPAVQILLFGGLSLVIDALTLGHPAGVPEQRQAAETVVDAVARPAGAVGPPGTPARPGLLGAVDARSRRAQARIRARWRRLVTWPARVRWRPLVTWPARVRWRTLPSRVTRSLVPERVLAAIGGLCLGLTSLLSIGSLVYLIPVIVVAGVLIAARRTTGNAFCIGIGVGAALGVAAGYVLARPLMDSLAPTLEAIGRDAAGAVVLTVVVLLVLGRPKIGGFVRRLLARRPLRWLPGFGGLLVIAAIAGLAARPSFQTVRRVLGRPEADFIASLQHIGGLPIDPTRLYSEYTLYWVIWYAGAATLLLGGFGAAMLVRRCLRSALSWRDPTGTRLGWALPLAVVVGGSAAILWQPFTVPDQPWASRRLAPVVLPGLILLGTWMAAWLTRRARDRAAGAVTVSVIAALCVGAMLIPSGFTSFGIGLTHSGRAGGLRLTAAGLAQHRVGTGQADAVRGLCSAIGQSSSVLIVDRRIAGQFTEVIRGMCGVPVAWVGQATPVSEVDAVLGGIVRAGRHPVVLGASSRQVSRFGGSPVRVMNLVTTQDSHELTRQAGPPWSATYVIWMTAATTPSTGI